MNHRWWPWLGIFLFAAFGLAAQKLSPAPGRFQFREPHWRGYVLDPAPAGLQATGGGSAEWLSGRSEQNPESTIEFGRRLLLRLRPGKNMNPSLQGDALQLVKTIHENTFILQATNALTALQEASRLSQSPDVLICAPVMRRSLTVHSAYLPNDPYFSSQWNLSQRDTNGVALGADLNIRGAWDITRGGGIMIGVADDGVELTHPELAPRAAGAPHYNFALGIASGVPVTDAVSSDDQKSFGHGTAVAGMALAEGHNAQGIVGVAPAARLASWVIFTTNSAGNRMAVNGEQLMEMFQHRLAEVPVQNHSWGNEGPAQNGLDVWAALGIENAVANGRGGRGVVMVRGVANERYYRNASTVILANANDDGYPADRRVIAVAGANATGRVTRYSNPGACILVAAPVTEWIESQDRNPDLRLPSLFMVDRQGPRGYNTAADELADYCFSNNVPVGTSFATPQIAGLAALLLSVNTNLSYRDVQQILALSARHLDLADPDLQTNGAGLRVSHNVGFGIPDASVSVKLAQQWMPRPALTSVSFTNETPAAVPDDGLRVIVSNAPPELQTIAASPTTGRHVDEPTALCPIVDVGQVVTNIPVDLTGKIALMQRGGATFSAKLQFAAAAGAAGAIIYNHTGGTDRLPYALSAVPKLMLPMTDTDFVSIPAVFINQQNGEALRNFISTNAAHVQFHLLTTNYTFTVTNQLLCEHIEVEVDGDNTDTTGSTNSRRGDIRITLLSPTGTRSVLQRLSTDTNKLTSPAWTYQTTHSFFENSAGNWTVAISDESPGATAVIRSVVLRIYGTEIKQQPATVSGRTFTFSITSGAGNEAENGSYLWTASAGNYRLAPRAGGLVARSGPYTTSLTGPARQRIETDQEILQLIYLSPSQGIFASWNSLDPSHGQTGTFTVRSTSPDLNFDGRPDLLFQASGGVMAAWRMQGTNFLGAAQLSGPQPLAGWRASGWTDFNADAQADVFLQNAAGQLAVRLMDGTNFLDAQLLRGGLPPAFGWKNISAHDFNSDGQVDFLFQHSRGPLAVWLMDGTNLTSSVLLRNGNPVAPGWQAFGAADGNGDLQPDIFFQHQDGRLAVWYLHETHFIRAELLCDGLTLGTGWRATGVTDVDGDGLNDILFQNTFTRALTAWHLHGKNFLRASVLKSGSPGWQLVGPK